MKQRVKRLQNILIILFLCLGLLVGCSAELKEFLWAIFLQWSADHAGELIAYGVTGSSGNEEVDAVMGVKSVVSNISEADKLMEQGRKDGDTDKMVEAINKRPGDYTYRTSYATELLVEGDAPAAAAQFEAADQLAASYGSGFTEHYASQGIADLESVSTRYPGQGWGSPTQCQLYWARLEYYYRLRNSVAPSVNDVERADVCQIQAESCVK